MKKIIRSKQSVLILIGILLIAFACNMPINDLARDELNTGLRMVTEETLKEELAEINQQIVENFVGKNNYSVSPPKGVKNDSKCDQGHPTDKKVTTTNSIDRDLGEESWIDDKVVIKEEGKTHVYTLAVPVKPNVFCRQTENSFVECIYLSDKGYSIRVFEEPYHGSYQPYAFDDFKPCHELNYNWEGAVEQNLSIDLEQRLEEVPGKWDINQCNAITDINKSQTEFSDGEIYDEEGGYLEYTFCEYHTVFRNTGGLPVSIIYYHYRYDEKVDDSEWVKVSARAPGEEYSKYNYVDKYESNDYLSASVITRFAAIYDIPNCSWIKEGGIHYDIVTILEQDFSPCTVYSAFEGRNITNFPDSTEGLIKD